MILPRPERPDKPENGKPAPDDPFEAIAAAIASYRPRTAAERRAIAFVKALLADDQRGAT